MADGEITRLLNLAAAGDTEAADRLWELVYGEIHALAARKTRGEAPHLDLQATVVCSEVWFRVSGERRKKWASSAEFFAAVAQAIDRVRLDAVRRYRARNPSGGPPLLLHHSLAGIAAEAALKFEESEDVERLLDAVDRLYQEAPKAATALRLQVGFKRSVVDVAAAMEVGEEKVKDLLGLARRRLRELLKVPDALP